MAVGNSAYNLRLTDLAIEAYSAAAAMVPNSYGIRNDLAESQIDAGLYNDALTELEWSLGITGESGDSTRALFLKGKALKGLGRLDQASETLRQGLAINYMSGFAQNSLKLLSNIDTEKGIALAIESYDAKISQNPQDAVSYYLRGQANITLGEPANAVADITESMALGLNPTLVIEDLSEAIALKRGYAYIDPQHVTPYIARGTAHLWAARGKAQLRSGSLGQAMADANSAIHLLSGNFGAPEWDNRRQEINLLFAGGHELLGDVYTASGQPENAEAEYKLASGLR
jgi:tetratricopeptide (TPR) repeat protein